MTTKCKNYFLLITLSLLVACAPVKTINAANNYVELDGIKFVKQTKNMCGVASAKTILDFFNKSYTNIDLIYNNKINGTKFLTLFNFLHNYLPATIDRIDCVKAMESINSGFPIIAMIRGKNSNHYVVVKGYSFKCDLIINDGYEENRYIHIAGDSSIDLMPFAIFFGNN